MSSAAKPRLRDLTKTPSAAQGHKSGEAQARLAKLREVDNTEWMKEVEAQLQELREALAATAATADRAAQDSFGFRTLG